MQRVNQAIFKRLSELLPDGVDIYPCVAEEDAVYPYCIYNANSFTVSRTKQGIYRYTFTYKVDIWGTTFNGVDDYAGVLMEYFNGDLDEAVSVALMGGVADYVEGGYTQSLEFEVRYYPENDHASGS